MLQVKEYFEGSAIPHGGWGRGVCRWQLHINEGGARVDGAAGAEFGG